MKYQLEQNYKDFNVFEKNALKARTYFIPYPDKESQKDISLLDYRYNTPFIKLLNGNWDFKFYSNPNDCPNIIDTDNLEFDKLEVPSCVQLHGYDIPMYVNMKYLFFPKPPRIPTTKPVGIYPGGNNANPTHLKLEIHNVKDSYNFIMVYRRFFDVKDLNKDFTMRFFGVCSCFDLYINSKFVGYAEGSHNSHEFDVNDFVVEGSNELVVIVHRWCNGTYLECQDMFRLNGIFRDVVLYQEPKTRIIDFNFETIRKTDILGYDMKLSINIKNPENTKLRIKLNGEHINLTKEIDANEINKIDEYFPNVVEWNPEEPTLYKLELELLKNDDCFYYVKKNVGFKNIVIKKDKFYFNDRLIKMKGVNHHDTNPKTGFVMTPADIDLDLKICKQYGINTIRTSHYPPDPLLLELANIYGFYIVAEADIETHGLSNFNSKSPKISNNLEWKNHFLDRAKRLYEPFKNEISVTMWSLGNEAGGIACQNEMEKYFKSVTNIPLHYESTIYCDRIHFDVTSMMYPSIPFVHDVGAKKLPRTDKNIKIMEVPYFLCEYAHAMGVGPGCLEEYVDEFYKYDSLMGGCIWEFADHAIYHENGPIKYTYGGDHGEYWHDGNFCCDGLFYPDRTPSSGALNMKYCYRPVKITYKENNIFELFNTNNFKSTGCYKITYIITDGINELGFGEVKEIVPAFTKKEVKIKLPKSNTNLFVNFSVIEIDSNIHFEEQIIIKELIDEFKVDVNTLPNVDNTINTVSVKFTNGMFNLDKTSGSIQYISDDKKLIESSSTSLIRIKLDNDAYDCKTWIKTGLTTLKTKVLNVEVLEQNDSIKVDVKKLLSSKSSKFEILNSYTIYNDGTILVSEKLFKTNKPVVVPRFGEIYKLDSAYQDVEYFGRRDESYIDFMNHSPIGLYKNNFKNMMEPNLRPQETGNRCNTSFANISNGGNTIKFVAVETPFELACKTMSEMELLKMTHREDQEKANDSYVTISAFNIGVGTGICGPHSLDKYRMKSDKDYELKYYITR